MTRFNLKAKTERLVTDTIDLVIDAADENTAYEVAGRVLEVFPQAHEEDGVSKALVVETIYHEPWLLELKDEEDLGIG